MDRPRLAGDIPASLNGERSRVILGDTVEYSIVDSPNHWWPKSRLLWRPR